MDPEIEELKKRVESVPRVGRKRRYTADLKRRVIAYVEKQIADGKTESWASKELGLFQGTVSEWRRGRSRAKPRTSCDRVRPVELAQTEGETLTLVLGGEARIEGLSLEQAIEVAKALR